jgi:hypothetical protein
MKLKWRFCLRHIYRSLTLGVYVDSKEYDGLLNAPLAGAELFGVRSGDDCSLDQASLILTYADPHPGENKSVTVSGITLVGAQAAHYRVTIVTSDPAGKVKNPVVGMIDRRHLVASFAAFDKPYDGNADAQVGQVTLVGDLPEDPRGVLPGDDCTLVFAGASFDTADPGTDKIVTLNGVYLQGDQVGYYFLQDVTATASISP